MRNGLGMGLGVVRRVALSPGNVVGAVGGWRANAYDASIGSLRDLSGKGVPLAQATSTKRPVVVASGIGGQPSLQFDGVDDGLQAASSSSYSYDRTQAFSLFIVAKSTSTYSGDAPLISKGNGISLGMYFAYSFTGNVRLGLANSGTNRAIGDAADAFQNVGQCYVVTYDGSSSTAGMKVRANGANLTVGSTVNALSASIVNSTAFSLGYNAIGSAFAGLWSEAWLWTRVVSATEIALLELYAKSGYHLF